MTDAERLGYIKTKIKVLEMLADDVGNGEANLQTVANDMNWLVDRVELTEKYGAYIDGHAISMESITKFTNQIKNENKRLREALVNIKDEEEQNLEGYESTVYKIVCEALEVAK